MQRVRIRIVKVPAGQAPLWVREAWVGVEIPLVETEQAVSGQQVGALGGAASPENLQGYEVHGSAALTALCKAGKSEAADWWRMHSALGGGHLVFGKQFCELV